MQPNAGQLLGDERVEVVAPQLAVGHDVAAERLLQPQQLDDRVVGDRDRTPRGRCARGEAARSASSDRRRPRPAPDRRDRKQRQRRSRRRRPSVEEALRCDRGGQRAEARRPAGQPRLQAFEVHHLAVRGIVVAHREQRVEPAPFRRGIEVGADGEDAVIEAIGFGDDP